MDTSDDSKSRDLWMSPEELQECNDWMPSKEVAEEYFRMFPVDFTGHEEKENVEK